MNYETIKLILNSMREELPNRETYLKNLKELTNHYRINVDLSSISNEIDGINKSIKSETLTENEKEEFLVVKNELETIFNIRNK